PTASRSRPSSLSICARSPASPRSRAWSEGSARSSSREPGCAAVTELATRAVPDTAALAGGGGADDDRGAGTELGLQRGGLGLLVLSALAALVVHSGFFHRADWLAADHMYHRGVAYNVQGGPILPHASFPP